jgi:glycosyltransferase involved in cell wall biosynthesis
MASGTPVVAAPDAAVREVAGDAARYAEPEKLAEAVSAVLADREQWARAGLERAGGFSWEETARRTVEVYRKVLAA